METSAPKRRRTSPRTSVAVDPNNNNNNDNGDNNAESNSTPREETPEPGPRNASPSTSLRRRRPDFASPTKASLARHNPDILARRRSEHASGRLARQSEERPGTPSRTPPESTVMLAAAAVEAPENPAASRAGSRESDVSLSDILTARAEDPPRGGLAGVPRRSPIKPLPIVRPLPPPAPEGEELVDPFSRRPRIRRSDPTLDGQVAAAEPELPPTPSQLGMGEAVASTPPAGIHSESSPLKGRQAPREGRRARPSGSSPLKKGAAAAAVAEVVGARTRSAVDLLANPQEVPRGRAAGAVRAHPARGVAPDDEVARKEAYLEALKKEEADLWSDLSLLAGLGRQWAEDGAASRLLPVVKKHPTLLRQPEEDGDAAADGGGLEALLGGATDPSSWLLFANPATQPAPTAKKVEEGVGGNADLSEPKSHRPVPMAASEELPFLQMFTPLTLTSSGAPLSRDDIASYVRRHAISLRAADCPSLFSAHVSLAVDLADFSVSDLRVARLDPRAEPELAPFLDDLVTRTDRAASGNVALACWAMGEWYRAAVRRAAFWRELHAEVGDSAVALENVGRMWKRRGAVGARGEGRGGAEAEDEGLVGVKAGTAGDLAPYMGTAAATVPLGFCGEGVVLRIEWRISFDWTGDAQAKVDLAVGVPGHWHKADPDGVLAGIPKVFDDIVRGTSNVKSAVRRVIALLADRG